MKKIHSVCFEISVWELFFEKETFPIWEYALFCK